MFYNENNNNKNKLSEVSLLELLNKEEACVKRLNECVRAIDIAKKGGIRSVEYERDTKAAEKKLVECRQDIKEYFNTKLK